MISQVEGLVTDILNTYVLAVMLSIKGWNLLNTEDLTSVQTKDDFCTYCQNLSKLQWLLLTPSLPQSHKSIKVPLTNNYNTSIIILFFILGAASLTYSNTLQWGQIIMRASLTFQLDFTHISVFQHHNIKF